jgi:Fe(3+) dicitrate transport protein
MASEKITLTTICLTAVMIFGVTSARAQYSPTPLNDSIAQYYGDTLWSLDIPVVFILGEKPRLMSGIPGSAAYIDPKTINELQSINGSEALRTVPGVQVVEEEGVGMRLNIGIRGLDPDRSSRVLILEDGIPVALNPYGEPQMYYSPTIDRMASIEVLKGSGQVLFGPQTIGGVVNFITAAPPEKGEGRVRVIGGEGGYLSALAGYGNTVGNTGFRLDYLRKQGDNIGPTSFRINDLTGKLNTRLSGRSSLAFKFGVYNELSNSTYVGLTQTMYEQGGQDYVRLAPDDRLSVRRYSASLAHELRFNQRVKLTTTAFGYTTMRNWQRQEFSSNPGASNRTGIVWGDESISGGAIYMRDLNGHRNRQFEVAGVESRLAYNYTLGKLDSRLDAGVRYLFERAYEQRVNGAKADARSGAMISDEIRSASALSAFVQNKFFLGERLSFSVGLRGESYEFERHFLRQQQRDTSLLSGGEIAQLIPGAGMNYSFKDDLTIFAGAHRGFAPPRIADAIANDGEVFNLDPELSWNYELGLRGRPADWVSWEATAFYMSFSNQVIPISESSGQAGAGSGLVNGGSTVHRGFEAAFTLNAGRLFLPEGHDLEIIGQATFVDAYYDRDRFIGEGENRVNIRGNRTPYAARWLAMGALVYRMPAGLALRFTGNYIGEQFTDELNTVEPSPDGRSGLLPAYFVIDAGAVYQFSKLPLALQAGVKNLTNERYIASRRPQGIRVGLPRMVTAGFEWKF